MPYSTNEDLPASVRRSLLAHAQDIYRQAFNNAWTHFRGAEAEREGRCHRIAWAAVKRWYHKDDDNWIANA
jgi:cation transport regulator